MNTNFKCCASGELVHADVSGRAAILLVICFLKSGFSAACRSASLPERSSKEMRLRLHLSLHFYSIVEIFMWFAKTDVYRHEFIIVIFPSHSGLAEPTRIVSPAGIRGRQSEATVNSCGSNTFASGPSQSLCREVFDGLRWLACVPSCPDRTSVGKWSAKSCTPWLRVAKSFRRHWTTSAGSLLPAPQPCPRVTNQFALLEKFCWCTDAN